jgi:polyhydroxyalkanoate synthesis repressor PhaR
MRTIKRYPNRKLYDCEIKGYTTLEGIAELIRDGEEVQVMDHETGADLTALTLSQIILDFERKQTSFLPRSVLTGLVRAGGGSLSILRRSLISSLDLFRQIDEEIERRVQSLINRGELAEGEARKLLDKLLVSRDPFSNQILLDEEYLQSALLERGTPTREDLRKLTEQVEAIMNELEDLNR